MTSCMLTCGGEHLALRNPVDANPAESESSNPAGAETILKLFLKFSESFLKVF